MQIKKVLVLYHPEGESTNPATGETKYNNEIAKEMLTHILDSLLAPDSKITSIHLRHPWKLESVEVSIDD